MRTREFHPFQRVRANCLRALRLAIAVVLFANACAYGHAQNDADEYDIRAAMLFNIIRFVEWPAWKVNAQHPRISICIIGPDPIGPSFAHFLQDQASGNRGVQVHHLSSFDSSDACQIAYISLHAQKNLKLHAAELTKSAVLVISERPNTSSPDQVIGLPTIDEHVHIEVDLAAAKRAGIMISSKLLRLATVTR